MVYLKISRSNMLPHEHESRLFPQYESLFPDPTNETTGEYG
jgi:hypothetical protein